MKPITSTIERLKPSGIRKYFDLANAMEGVISLGGGEPDFDTPWHISAKAVESFAEGHTHYTANRGLIALRRQIAKYPEIDSLYLITGDNDVICLVQGRTMFEVCQFVADRIAVMENVQSTKPLFVLKQYKHSGVLTGAGRTTPGEGRLVVSY